MARKKRESKPICDAPRRVLSPGPSKAYHPLFVSRRKTNRYDGGLTNIQAKTTLTRYSFRYAQQRNQNVGFDGWITSRGLDFVLTEPDEMK